MNQGTSALEATYIPINMEPIKSSMVYLDQNTVS